MPDDDEDAEGRPLRHLRHELLDGRGALSVEQVHALFDAVVADFDGAPVRTFGPMPARRRLRQELSRGR